MFVDAYQADIVDVIDTIVGIVAAEATNEKLEAVGVSKLTIQRNRNIGSLAKACG